MNPPGFAWTVRIVPPQAARMNVKRSLSRAFRDSDTLYTPRTQRSNACKTSKSVGTPQL
jgi:hypothetical protein